MRRLIDAVGGYTALSVIGMCKNAGKTTALNRIIRDLAPSGHVLGLTSIGRDGERVDVVTGTAKPGIYVAAGTLIATAAGLLKRCDITREILEATGIPTPLGEVVLARALSDGHVELAGPSMISQLVAVKALFLGFGAGRVVIDGAVSRKTLCARALSDATVLSVGASCGRSMADVAAETGHVCRMLGLPRLEDAGLTAALGAYPGARMLVLRHGGAVTAPATAEALAETVKGHGDIRLVYIGGALSEGLADALVRAGSASRGLTLVAPDASKVMISADTYEKIRVRGWELAVLDSVRLAAVTVNPFSAYGYDFDRAAFLAAVGAAVDVPVYDVMDGEGPG